MQRRFASVIVLPVVVLLLVSGPQLLAQIRPSAEGALIRLNHVTFDPRAGEPSIPQALRAPAESGAGTYLLQFNGPVQEQWKAAANAAGATLYGYIPDHAFIARIDAAALAGVRALPFVRWVGPYHPAYRLDASLAGALVSDDAAVTLQAQTLPDADLDALSSQIGAWGGTVAGRSANVIAGYVQATLPAGRVGDLAAWPEVVWVAPYHAPLLFNDIGGGQIMRANDVRTGLGLFGAGQTVAVADSGLDVGDANSVHLDFRGRVAKAYCLGRPSPCDWSDPHGHGTHVAGSVLGSGSESGSNPTAHNYSGSFAGVAPESRLVFQSIMDSNNQLTGIPDDEGDLMRQGYQDGARIHTNSWGGPTGGTSQNPEYGGYVPDSQQVDLAAWEHKDMLILFAAGNEGADANSNGVIDPDSIGQPGTAKNVVTVGASENLRPTDNGNCTWGGCFGGFGANPVADDLVSDDADGLAAFSSRGPTDDGRIKPDVVAPGTNIVSALSQHPQAGTGWGAHPNTMYAFQGGTSMATPLAAGGAAVVREWLTRVRGMGSPSGALMRGVLINGAADMSPGQYGGGATQEIPARRPNNVTGWGRVDLREALMPQAPRGIWFVDNTGGLNTGGTATYEVNVTAAQMQSAGPVAQAQSARPVGRARSGQTKTFADQSGVVPQGAAQLVQNGGFENSALAPWETFGNTGLDTTVYHSGAKSARMGGADAALDQVYQTVNIPANASDVTIDFWYGFSTDEFVAGFDFFCYGLYDTQDGEPIINERCDDIGATGDRDWTRLTNSLTANERSLVAGKSVTLGFYVDTSFFDPSAAWVDDVALAVTTPDGGSSPTPTTPTATSTTPTNTPPSGGSGNPLRVTLAWTDFPGEPAAAKALVNDLDLEVVAPNGARYSGNQGLYGSGQCLRDAKWDACNPTEGVIIPQAAPGKYTIIVRGAQVPQGGAQPFALVASGDGLGQVALDNAVSLPLIMRVGPALSAAAHDAPTPTPPATPAPAAVLREETRIKR